MAVKTQIQRQKTNESNKAADFFRSMRKRLDNMVDGDTFTVNCRPPIDAVGFSTWVYRQGFDTFVEGNTVKIVATPPLEPWRAELVDIYSTMYKEISELKPGEFLKLPELPEFVDLDKIYNWAIEKGFYPTRKGDEFLIARRPK
jgi:hypothetical protein